MVSYSIHVIAEYNLSDSKIIWNQIILSTYRCHKLHQHPNTLSEVTTKATVKPQSEAYPEAYTLHCPLHQLVKVALGQHSQQIGNKFPTTNHTSVASLPKHRPERLVVEIRNTLTTSATCCESLDRFNSGNMLWQQNLLPVDLSAPVASTHSSCECVAEGLQVDMRLLLPVFHNMLRLCCEFDLRLPLGKWYLLQDGRG